MGYQLLPMITVYNQCCHSKQQHNNPTSVMHLTKRIPSLAPLILARQSLK